MAIDYFALLAQAQDSSAPAIPHALPPAAAIGFVLLGSFALLILDLQEWARLPKERRANLTTPEWWIVRFVFRPLAALIVALIFVFGDQPLTTFTATALGAGATEMLERILKGAIPQPPAVPTAPGQ